MEARSRRPAAHLPRVRGLSLILGGLALVGVLVAGRMATGKFTWWKDARFAGRVVGKEARLRDSGQTVESATAIQNPGKCQFFLKVAGEEGAKEHEVIVSVFRGVKLGDHVVKAAGSYKCIYARAGSGSEQPGKGASGP